MCMYLRCRKFLLNFKKNFKLISKRACAGVNIELNFDFLVGWRCEERVWTSGCLVTRPALLMTNTGYEEESKREMKRLQEPLQHSTTCK